jgi:TetR/AcrR family transcriptional regulator, transcriptional repressor for nem operon
MGHSQKEKEQHHGRIVRVAAARFREDGVGGVGVAELMQEAGLTHGGFYRHFASRDDLVAEAIACALRDGGQAVAALANLEHDALSKLIEAYLSEKHRDDLATSCAVATLAADVARCNRDARTAYTNQVSTYLEILTKLIAGESPRARRKKAIAALSTLVGAVSLARAVNDKALSSEILDDARDELKAQLLRRSRAGKRR